MAVVKMYESKFIRPLERTHVNWRLQCLLALVFVSLYIQGSSADCEEGYTACSDGLGCYRNGQRCDRLKDCHDGTDERDCQLVCEADEFACVVDDMCQPLIYKCDGGQDCSDNSDEQHCDNVTCTEESEFQCVSDRKCIQHLLRCDGISHCHDNSDEEDCTNGRIAVLPSGCDEDTQFDCLGDGTECISIDDQCNQNADCTNGQDENSTICNQFVTEAVASVVTQAAIEKINEPNSEPDENECDDGPCAHECVNTEGSFVCTCVDGYQLATDRVSCIVEGAEPELIVANGSRLLAYGLHSGGLHSGGRHTTSLGALVHGIAYDTSRGGKIFYINSERKVISWIHKDHTGPPETLIDTIIVNPVSVAYDWIHDSLYWADAGNVASTRHARIEVVELKHKYRTTLLASPQVHSPRYLVVDPREGRGYLYWAEVGNTPDICRSGLDGSEPKCFVSPNIGQPSGLCLDFLTNTLFWMDRKENTLVSYSLDDFTTTVLTTITEYPRHPSGLDIFEDWLYWADDTTKAVYKWNIHTMQESDKPIELLSGLVSAKDVVVYHPYKQHAEESFYCGTDNHGCSHICLPSPHFKKYRCACPNVDKLNTSYILDDDNKLCLTRGANEVLPDSSSHLDNGIVNHDPSSHVSRDDADPDAPILPTVKPTTKSLSIADGQGKSEASSAHMSKWVGIGVGVGVGAIVLLVSAVV